MQGMSKAEVQSADVNGSCEILKVLQKRVINTVEEIDVYLKCENNFDRSVEISLSQVSSRGSALTKLSKASKFAEHSM